MILTTTQNIEGRTITEYLGIVCGEAFENKEFKGERYYLSILTNARNLALKQLEERADSMGADAVVGVRIDFDVSDMGPCIMVNASGTAVRLK
jgi:uncharacterized protein YbjQ (UPF0145 family)